MKYQAVVIGAGLSGAVMAERLASQLGWRVLVLEQRDHVGGNCYDEYDQHGILIHRYGPHLFHTDRKDVWEYLSKFTEWTSYEHRVLSRIDGKLIPIPFNLTSIERCFPFEKAQRMISALLVRFGEGARVPILELRQEADPLLNELAEYIYRKAFVNYTSKQWGVAPENISPEVTARVPVVVSRDDRYFVDPYQAVPSDGYTAMLRNILSHPNIDVCLSCTMSERLKLESSQGEFSLDGETFNGWVVYTGMLDKLTNSQPLPYRSLRFDHQHIDIEYFQPTTTVNYPNDELYTRVTEFKHITGQVHRGTSIVYEYACDYKEDSMLEPYYPVLTDGTRKQYESQVGQLSNVKKIILLGRLAQYKYYDMDDAVWAALDKFNNIFGVK